LTKNHPICGAYKLTMSLARKQGIIKHDVLKFTKNFGAIEALQESSANHKNVIKKALKLY
jgi:hypothetical protein